MRKEIVFAGGCFWGVQEYFRRVNGVLEIEAGYAQGTTKNPTYEEVKAQTAKHAEVCYIVYDDSIIKLEKLLNLLFRIIDPTSMNHQGNDYGLQYRCGVYYINASDKDKIETYISQQQSHYNKKLVVECEPLMSYYPAETYHQEYLVKNTNGYCHVDFQTLKKEEVKEAYKDTIKDQ